MSPSMNEIVQLAVHAKLNELASIPVGFRSGRRLTADDLRRSGYNITAEQLREGLSRNFTDVANRLGVEFFMGLPAALLEQFTFMSIMRNEDTAGMLKSLINSFMITYATPETAASSFSHLEGLETLRAEVAKSRSLTPATLTPHPSQSRH